MTDKLIEEGSSLGNGYQSLKIVTVIEIAVGRSAGGTVVARLRFSLQRSSALKVTRFSGAARCPSARSRRRWSRITRRVEKTGFHSLQLLFQFFDASVGSLPRFPSSGHHEHAASVGDLTPLALCSGGFALDLTPNLRCTTWFARSIESLGCFVCSVARIFGHCGC